MSLIIEGADNLGKTTFAKKLVRYILDHDKYSVMYSWMTRPNEETFDFFESYKMMLNPYTVQDRFHLGALAYHKDKISDENLNWIEVWIRDVGGFVVLFYAKNSEWYASHIAKDRRGNLLGNGILCTANCVFTDMVLGQHPLRPDYKYAFDISNENWIDELNVERIAEAWMKHRQRAMERLVEKINQGIRR